jgi:hypothetical protein|tara:strand:+ start:67 stop:237 length:171 start_codon:yes stop_codon:yes gene_type:complete
MENSKKAKQEGGYLLILAFQTKVMLSYPKIIFYKKPAQISNNIQNNRLSHAEHEDI